MAGKMSKLDVAASTLAGVGALNWGLVSMLNFNLVETIFGFSDVLVKVLYGAVGLAGLYVLYWVLWGRK